MFLHNKRGERRVSPPVYRFLLAAHVLVSGAWLGVVAAKLALAVAAATSDASDALYVAMGVVNVAFPPMAVATLVTGVLLSLGTKWGLLRHYWIAAKLLLIVGVVVTGIALVDRLIQRSVTAQAMDGGQILGVSTSPATLLVCLSAAHVLMLGAATVLSVYKPWGKTPLGRTASTGRDQPRRDGTSHGDAEDRPGERTRATRDVARSVP